MVPTMQNMGINYPDVGDYDFSCVEFGIFVAEFRIEPEDALFSVGEKVFIRVRAVQAGPDRTQIWIHGGLISNGHSI